MWLTSEAKALSSDARVISAIQYATQASIYQSENMAAELTTAQTAIISLLYALKQKDLPFIKTLLEVSSTVPQIKSSFLSVWLRDDFCFPKGDVAICLSTLGKLLLDGLQFPWTIAATLASLDVKYQIRECFVEEDDTAGEILLSTMNTRVSVSTQVDFAKELTSKESQTTLMKHVCFHVEKTSTGTQAGLIMNDRGVSVKPEMSTTGVQTKPESSIIISKPSNMADTVSTRTLPKPAKLQGFNAGVLLPTMPITLSGTVPGAQAISEDRINLLQMTSNAEVLLPTMPISLSGTVPGAQAISEDRTNLLKTTSVLGEKKKIYPEPKYDPVPMAGTGNESLNYFGHNSLPIPSGGRRTSSCATDEIMGKDMFEEYLSGKKKYSEKHPTETPKILSSSSSVHSASTLEEHPTETPKILSSNSSVHSASMLEEAEDRTKKNTGKTRLLSNKKHSIPKRIANELLYGAIQKDDAKCIVAAINAGADVNDEGVMKKRPLHVAASAGRIEPAIELIHRGANVNSSDNWGETPLFVASVTGHLLIAEILVAAGANINHRNSEGNCPLHVAASAGQLEIVRLFLSSGANVNCRGESLRTPLHCAALRGHLSVVGLLLDQGADPMAVDQSGYTPLNLANSNQQRLVVDFLFYRSR